MTHLKVEQNTGIIEQVDKSIVTKLYRTVNSDLLDLSSNLLGRIHTTATYLEHIDAIRAKYPDLYITSDNIYKYFEDPIIENVFANWVGDGIGSTMSQLNSITSLPRYKFAEVQNVDSANIISFNELGQLTTVKTLANQCFKNCSSLVSIDISNIESLGRECFCGCSSLLQLNFSNVKYVGLQFLHLCPSLPRYLYFPSIELIDILGFSYTGFLKLEFGPNLTTIGKAPFWDSKQLTTIIFHSTTVPSYSDSEKQNKFVYNMSVLTIYVPDESVEDYKNAWTAMANNIKGISELPS